MKKIDAYVRRAFVTTCLLLGFLVCSVVPVSAAINEQIDFYGTLQDDSGVNLTGTYDIVFRFYDASGGGTLLGTDTHTAANGNAVTVRNGKFAVVLGTGTGNSLAGIDFDSPTIYVGLTIDSDSEMVPRERLTAAPYAFNADKLDGYHANQLLRYNATGSMTTSSADTILSLRQNGIGKIFTLFGGATEVFSVLANGRVGIGTTTPGRDFVVNGDAQFTGGLYDGLGTAGTLGMILQTTGTSTRWVATSTLGLGGGGSGVTGVGPAGSIQTGSTLTLATSTSAFNGLTAGLLITGAGNTITYTPTLTGTLSNAGLANSTIAFANGTTGSDVNWSTSPVSLGGTATLNIPSASASARGLLSSADWITFTNKISSTSLDTITELDSLITDVTGVTGTGSFVLSASPTFTGTTTAANFSLSGVFRDVTNNAGTNGMVLLSTGTSTLWVATSSLGIDGGTPGGSLFTDGGATTYLTSLGDTLGIGTTSSIAKMTVAGDINLDGNYGFSLNNIRYFSGTTDTNNIQIGRDAGLLFSSLNTSNVAIGHEAGRYASTTNADYNVMIGYQAGLHNTAAGNVLLGYGAGDYNSDYGNIMLGEFAGQNNSSDSNILIGNNTGRYNSSFSNIFIGESAGENNTNNSNYFIGVGAGKNNIGTVNTIIGYNAGVDNTGDENVSIGDNAGYANQGDHNNILGAQAGLDNRGDYNNLFGESAGYSNRGSFNNVVGYLAAYNNTGAYNDIIGYQAGANLQATNTVAIGANALSGGDVLTNGAGNFQALNNVAIGYRAGYSAETGADNNVFIGYQAGSNVTTGKNNIVLGYDLFLQSATQNNSLTIGNLLFATGLTATGTATSTGKFGLGTSTPSAQLTTVGTVRLAAFGSGALQSDALGNISVSSDERLKDIQGEFTKGLDVLMAIDPIQYKWKTSTGYDTANVYTGFSAQNVQMVLPEAVGKSNDGYLTLSDRPILAAVINAIKEIYAWMHTTDARVNTLEAQVQSMQSEIDALKSNNTPSQPQGDNNQSSNQPIPTDASVVTPTSTVPSTSDTAPATLPDATSDSEVVSTPETGESESGPVVPNGDTPSTSS